MAGFFDFVTDPGELLLTFALVLSGAALLSGSLRNLRLLALFAGLAAAMHFAFLQPDGAALIWVLLLLLANAAQLALMISRARSGLMRREERELVQLVLKVEEPTSRRRLLDLIEWRDAGEGEVLMRQGQPQPPFVYVARGKATVELDGKSVGSAGVGDFLGEMSLVTGGKASASVIASEPMRIGIFDRDRLLQLSSALPELGRALDHALNRGMAAKIARMNAAAAGDSEGAARARHSPVDPASNPT